MGSLSATLLGLLLLAGMARAAPEDVMPTPTPSPVFGDGVIVPGQRVGGVRLAMPLAQIVALAGPDYKREEFPDEQVILYEWRDHALWISIDRRTRAIRVISVFGTAPGYRTDRGVRLLQPFTSAEAAYGSRYRRWVFQEEKVLLVRYTELGLQFGVVHDPDHMLHGRIFQIGVFRPGDLPPVRQP